MPSQRDLPDALAKLARQNALELSDSRWSQDVQRLVEILGQVVTTRVEENAQKKAARLARVAERKRERESFLQSTEGIHAAQESLAEMFRYLEEQTSSIKQTPNAPRITLTAKDRFNCLVQGPHRGFRMTYFQEFNNTLEYSHLLVMEFRGLYSEDRGETFDIFRRVAVVFDLDDKSLPAWREKDAPDSFYTAKELGDRYLKRVLDSPKAAGFTKYRC